MELALTRTDTLQVSSRYSLKLHETKSSTSAFTGRQVAMACWRSPGPSALHTVWFLNRAGNHHQVCDDSVSNQSNMRVFFGLLGYTRFTSLDDLQAVLADLPPGSQPTSLTNESKTRIHDIMTHLFSSLATSAPRTVKGLIMP